MVTQYGMSNKMGPMVFGQRHEMVFLGRDIGEQRNYSELVAREIDKEVRRIVATAYERAKEILTKYSDLHKAISMRLIQVETIDAEEFESFFTNVPGAPSRQFEPNPPSAPAPNGNRAPGADVPGRGRSGQSPNPAPAPA
jgi:cell division protease FtsH